MVNVCLYCHQIAADDERLIDAHYRAAHRDLFLLEIKIWEDTHQDKSLPWNTYHWVMVAKERHRDEVRKAEEEVDSENLF